MQVGAGAPSSEIQPQDVGVIGWTGSPVKATSAYQLSTAVYAGKLLTYGFKVPVSGTINTINYIVTGVGSGLSNCYFGIYSWTGSLLAQCTVDQSTNFVSINTHTAALSSSLAVTGNTPYRVGLVIGAATAFPTFGTTASQVSTVYTGLGLTGAGYICAAYGAAGAYTALPGSFTPASLAGMDGMLELVMN